MCPEVLAGVTLNQARYSSVAEICTGFCIKKARLYQNTRFDIASFIKGIGKAEAQTARVVEKQSAKRKASVKAMTVLRSVFSFAQG